MYTFLKNVSFLSVGVHSSHDVRSIRGVTFCFKFGACGKVKLHRLAVVCADRLVSKVDEIRRDKLMKGELPVSSMCWPSGVTCMMNPPCPLLAPSLL